MSDLEYFVEYHPNEDQEETVIQMTEMEFISLIADHKSKGIDPLIEYDKFTVFENGRSGRRLTIRDDHGIYYN
tara:strand:+ start:1003 stop:1221 length:219 start_codon:yes stop_codon:yes gene_type:complete